MMNFIEKIKKRSHFDSKTRNGLFPGRPSLPPLNARQRAISAPQGRMFTVERIGANKGSVAGGRRPTLHILPFFYRVFFSASFRRTHKNGQKRKKYDFTGKKRKKKDRNGRKRMEKNIFYLYFIMLW